MAQAQEFLSGGGQMVALMRAHDWSSSPLGPPESWPQSLRTVVGLLLQSRVPMFVAWGKDLGFLYNDPYAEILGAKHPRALGRPFSDIWSEIWTDISPLIDAAMAGEASYHENLPLLMNRKGFDEETWFTFSYSPVREESGRVGGMFCACFETTPVVLAQRALRELNETLERRVSEGLSERKLLADIVAATDAIVLVIGLDYTILAINPAAAAEFDRVYGVRAKGGDNLLAVLDGRPEYQVESQTHWSRALAGDEFTTIVELVDLAGERRAYEIRFSALRDREGQRIGAYQFVYDVTERLRDQERLRTAEAALRQTQKMESLGQLTGGVAHDFNNLLSVFASGLQILERSPGGLPPQRVLDAMRRAVARGTDLTRHLLAFSRRRPLNPESIDLASHLGGMRTMLDGALGGHIQVVMRLPPDLWPVVVDAGELELAIVNLCVNARDAMPEGGIITIEGENVAPSDDEAEPQVTIAIGDTGRGMTADVQARAFEPFFTTKDVSKGSGLGLPQVYGFAQQSGGRVDIHSAVDVGTVITVFLPRSMHEPSPRDGDGVEQHAGRLALTGHGSLLLVDDDPEVSVLARELLTTLGFTVTHVASAEAALAALADGGAFDIMLSDVMMPGGVSGLQLAREVRRRHPALKVVLTTGYVEAAAGMTEGEFTLLPKPVSLESLAAALNVDVSSSRLDDR